MRKEILSILNSLDICDVFYIGNGSRDQKCEIHLKIEINRANLEGKQFAIQFEETSRVVALWDIRERLSRKASLNLYYERYKEWHTVKKIEVTEGEINKSHSGISAKKAVMPVDQLEDFLRFNQLFDFPFRVDNSEFEEDDIASVDIIKTQEGHEICYFGKRYERNPELRGKAISLQGCICKICGFDFERVYGNLGHNYIEVHHIKPLYQGEQMPDPALDLIPVCANCHRMMHRQKYKTITPDELREIIKNRNR